MNLKNQKRTAADIFGSGINRVRFDSTRLNEIKEAITKSDIRKLIGLGVISLKRKKGISSFRANKIRLQKRRSKRKGIGSRKGKSTARISRKKRWMNKVRVQRNFLKLLKNKKLISKSVHRNLYKMIKGNLFRSKRHLKLYLEENKLGNKKNAV